MTDVREHPDYSDGFFDARDGKALDDGASPEYRAGWHAFDESRKLLVAAGFRTLPGGVFSKKTVIYPKR